MKDPADISEEEQAYWEARAELPVNIRQCRLLAYANRDDSDVRFVFERTAAHKLLVADDEWERQGEVVLIDRNIED